MWARTHRGDPRRRIAGAIIGNNVDRADESCAYQALEYAQPNTQVAWVNLESGLCLHGDPGPDQRRGWARYCREYQAKVMVGGRLQDGMAAPAASPMAAGKWSTKRRSLPIYVSMASSRASGAQSMFN